LSTVKKRFCYFLRESAPVGGVAGFAAAEADAVAEATGTAADDATAASTTALTVETTSEVVATGTEEVAGAGAGASHAQRNKAVATVINLMFIFSPNCIYSSKI
jgi:hypothetical protein